MKVLATYNIKGGVGKTSAAVNLGYLASLEGHRTLLWDLDPQAAATYLFRIRARVKGGGKALVRGKRSPEAAIKGTGFTGLDLLPADFTYRNLDIVLDDARKPTRRLTQLIAPLAAEYDLVILDCPPSISLVSENVLHAADLVLVPLIPTTLSTRTLDQLTDFVADLDGHGPEVFAFFSMVDRRKRLHREVMAQLSEGRRAGGDAGLAATAVPALSTVEQMATRRAPVGAYAPGGKAAESYSHLWGEVSTRLFG